MRQSAQLAAAQRFHLRNNPAAESSTAEMQTKLIQYGVTVRFLTRAAQHPSSMAVRVAVPGTPASLD